MIIQQDREFAADLALKVYGRRISDAIRAGETDFHHFIKAFMKHRLALSNVRTSPEDTWIGAVDHMSGAFDDREIIDSLRKDW